MVLLCANTGVVYATSEIPMTLQLLTLLLLQLLMSMYLLLLLVVKLLMLVLLLLLSLLLLALAIILKVFSFFRRCLLHDFVGFSSQD